jgi:hypothetical protein
MDVESLIQDTVLDNIVAFLRAHAASAQGVPRSLAVTLHPLLNVCNVLSPLVMNLEVKRYSRP